MIIGDLLRRADIPAASDLRLTTAAGRRLLAHDWPLNIRELQQCLAVSAALATRGVIEADLLPIAPVATARGPLVEPNVDDPAELRRTLIELLEQHRGNISHVARDLGKARMQIHRWLQRFDLDPGTFRR